MNTKIKTIINIKVKKKILKRLLNMKYSMIMYNAHFVMVLDFVEDVLGEDKYIFLENMWIALLVMLLVDVGFVKEMVL